MHSGDSVAVLPPQRLGGGAQRRAAEIAARLASALRLRGIFNLQMVAADDRLVVIEANPRASRTVPVVAKATGRDIVAAAVRCALGATLAEVGLPVGLAAAGDRVAVKWPVDSLWRLPGVLAVSGPEMRSTGEVLGLADTHAAASASARRAALAHQR